MKKPKQYLPAQVERMVNHQGCMSVRTHPGMRIVFTSPNAGWDSDKAKIKHLKMVVGQVFTVKRISVGGSSTRLTLEEFPGEHFNSVHFCNVPRQVLPETIHGFNYSRR